MKRRNKAIQPAVTIACGQTHLRSTKTEIKGLLCGVVQVTLKTGDLSSGNLMNCVFAPKSCLMTVKNQMTTGRTEVKVQV